MGTLQDWLKDAAAAVSLFGFLGTLLFWLAVLAA